DRKKPGSLGEKDQRRLDELQRAMRGGGLVLDVGEAAIDEIDGPWSGSAVHLGDIHGDTGDDAVTALGFSRMTEGGIERYACGATPSGDAGVAMSFQLGDVKAGRQRYRPAIPTAPELEKRRDKLQQRL